MSGSIDTSLDLFERVVRAQGVAYSEWTPGQDRIYASPALAALFDLDPDDWTVQRLMEHIHPDDAAGYKAGFTAFMKSDADRAEIAVRYRRRDGGMSWILNHNYAERDPSGRVTRLTTTSTDITQDKQREAENRALLARQAASVEVLKAITASPDDPQPVFDLIVRRACELCNAQAGNLVEYDGTLMHQRTLRGFAPEAEARLRAVFPRPPGLDTLPGRVVLTGQRVHLPDAQADQGLIQQGRGLGARAFLGVPLLREGQVIGVLGLARFDPGEYDQSAIELVQSFAEQAVIAIAGAKTLRELRDRTAELAERNDAYSERITHQSATIDVLKAMSASPGDPQPVFDLICQQANTLMGTSTVGLFEYDGELAHYRSTSSLADMAGAASSAAFASAWPRIPDRGSLTCRAILDGRIVHVRDLATDPSISRMVRDLGHRSQISVPLMRDGRAIGAISMASLRVDGFSDTQVDLLKTFAEQAVIAIGSAETYRALQTRTAELQQSLDYQGATINVLKVMSTSIGDTQPVFGTILNQAMKLCGCMFAVLTEFDGTLIHGRAAIGFDPEQLAPYWRQFPMAPTRATGPGRAILDRTMQHVRDILADPEVTPLARALGQRSQINVPLLRGEAVIGVISLGHKDVDAFTEAHIELLKTFAEQAVIAIGGTANYHALQTRTADLQESLEYQTATSDVLKVISRSTFDLQPVLETLLATAAQLCDADLGVISTRDGDAYITRATFNWPALDAFFHGKPIPITRGSLTGRTVLDGRVVHVLDLATDPEYTLNEVIQDGIARTGLGVPLLREGNVIGTINFGRTRVQPFNERQIELLRSFADQAVIAIENTRLLTEQREALEQQTATAEVLQVINASPGELAPVFDAMLEKAMRLCGAAFGLLRGFDGEFVRALATRGLPEALSDFSAQTLLIPPPDTTMGRALRTGRPEEDLDIRETDVYKSGVPGPRAIADLGGARTILYVPLVKDQVSVGLFTFYRQEVRPFSEKQILLVESFAAQAVIAMENARLLGELRRRTDDLQESLTYQTATSDVLKVISRSTFDLRPVLKIVVEKAARLCEADFGVLSMRDGDSCRVEEIYSGSPDVHASWRGMVVPADRGTITGRAVLEGRAVQTQDISTDPEYVDQDAVRITHTRSGLGVPLLREGAVIGAIALGRHRVEAFTEQQIELVSTFADQAVIAIENTRLLTEQQEALEQQTATAEVLQVINVSPGDLAPVFDAMLEKAMRICGAAFGELHTFDGTHFRAAALQGIPPSLAEFRRNNPLGNAPGSTSRRMIAGESLIQIADLAEEDAYRNGTASRRALVDLGGARSLLAVALRKDDILVGLIAIYRQEVRPFDERQVALLRNFGAQAVIAMENARLINEQRDALERQTATAEVLEVINASAGNLAPVFDVILEKALRICQPAFGTLNAFDSDKVVFLADRGTSADLAEYRAKNPGDGLSANVIRMRETRRSVHLLDIREGEAYRAGHAGPRAVADLGGARTLLLVPLLKEQAVVGSLQIYRTKVRAFTDNEISLLENFAAQAVIAMENARLINEQREALQQQTATAEVLQVINASPGDLVPVFRAILEKSMRLCEAAFGALWTYDGERLHPVAMQGLPAALADYNSRNSTQELTLLALQVIEAKRSILVLDLREGEGYRSGHPGSRAIVELGGARTVLLVPLLKEQAVVGFIQVYRQEVRAFTDKQIALLENFAAQAVIAMENARLINEQREALEQQTATAEVLQVINASAGDLTPVFDTIVEKAHALCGASVGSLMVYDGTIFRAVATHGYQADTEALLRRGVAPTAFLDPLFRGERICVRDAGTLDWSAQHRDVRTYFEKSGVNSILVIPLLKEQALLGYITNASFEARSFSDKQITLLENFAAQAVIAMESARLLNELRARTEELAQRQAELHVTFENMGDGVAMFDQAQHLVAWNRKFQDLLNVPDDIIAQRRSLPEYVRYLAERGEFGTDADVDEQVRRVLHTTDQMRVFERVRPNGSVIEVHSNPIAGGGFVLIYSDITERKRNEEAIHAARDAAEEASRTIEAAFLELKTAQANLIQAEKMASLGQLTAGIAHEIKNPLNFVNNFAILSVELLSELKEGIAAALALLTEDQRADVEETVGMLTGNLEKITEHGKRADGIVKAMLEHSRGASGERRTVDINALADEALNLAYHGARAQDQNFNISLERDFGGEISPIEVNPQDMTRVFLNLFSNGFYAANKRERNGADDFRPTLMVTTRAIGDAVEIRVRDNGTGIPGDIRDKLFQPFFTTKPTGEGTGLGLSITYDIVTKAHGGMIAVDSEVDEFTEFVVTLPRGMFSNEGSRA